jgi:hypothetical protein
MSLKDLIGDPPTKDNGKKSWIQTMQEELSDEDYQALIDAIKDKRYSAAYLSRKLSSAGHIVSRTTIAINRQRLLDE